MPTTTANIYYAFTKHMEMFFGVIIIYNYSHLPLEVDPIIIFTFYQKFIL